MDDDKFTEEDELDRQYNEIVDAHRKYLKKVEEAFGKHCEVIGNKAKKKLEGIPDDGDEENQAKRKEILTQEQKELDEALLELKQVVGKRDSVVRKKLEELENKRDANAMDLEAELANL